jgi:hypothetical protein
VLSYSDPKSEPYVTTDLIIVRQIALVFGDTAVNGGFGGNYHVIHSH